MKLKGKTKKGRERIKRDGADGWEIIRTTDWVAWSSDRGLWLFIGLKGVNNSKARWIHETRDPDFEIVER
jgi:hypothetical protein